MLIVETYAKKISTEYDLTLHAKLGMHLESKT